MSNNVNEKLIQLASYESGNFMNNGTISKTVCSNVCEKLYEFAKEDGHTIMNTSKYNCKCEKTHVNQ